MAAAEAGVLQLSFSGVLASVGCSGLAVSSARGAFAATLGSRVPPAGGKGARLSMRMGNSHGCVSTAMVVQGNGKGDEGGTLCERKNAPRPATPPCSLQVYAGRNLLGMKIKSPGLGRAAGAGREAATLVSAFGGGHEEADTATSAAADVVGVEAESSADAARSSWLQSASKPTATLRGVLEVSKCAAYEADCHRSGQAVKEQGGREVVGLRRREGAGVVSRKEENRLTHIRLDGKDQLEMSERFCRVDRHIDVGKSNRPVAPDLACRIAFALARGDLAPVSPRETLKLLWREVLGRDTPNLPQEAATPV
eukprot:4067507-Pleurochrysis_carterae.AAC.1